MKGWGGALRTGWASAPLLPSCLALAANHDIGRRDGVGDGEKLGCFWEMLCGPNILLPVVLLGRVESYLCSPKGCTGANPLLPHFPRLHSKRQCLQTCACVRATGRACARVVDTFSQSSHRNFWFPRGRTICLPHRHSRGSCPSRFPRLWRWPSWPILGLMWQQLETRRVW